jgi:hypothetical protein
MAPDANLLVHKENNVCPPAQESNGFMTTPIKLSGDGFTASSAYTINHAAATTKQHATNLFCDIGHTTIARIT